MKTLKDYHKVWLANHPLRTENWLREKLKDRFHIHHIDCNHLNNAANNLMLVEGADHLRLHDRFDLSEAIRLGKQTKKMPVTKEDVKIEQINKFAIEKANKKSKRNHASLYYQDSFTC